MTGAVEVTSLDEACGAHLARVVRRMDEARAAVRVAGSSPERARWFRLVNRVIGAQEAYAALGYGECTADVAEVVNAAEGATLGALGPWQEAAVPDEWWAYYAGAVAVRLAEIRRGVPG